VKDFGRLNANTIRGRNNNDDDGGDEAAILDYPGFIQNKCGNDTEICDFEDDCVQENFVDIFNESSDDIVFLESYQANCPDQFDTDVDIPAVV
jgi:hypothetical protein